MQTFLPYHDFDSSAEALDNDRLKKQIIEARAIFDTLTGRSEAWKNHPVMGMWRGYERKLAEYGMAICTHAAASRRLSVDYALKTHNYLFMTAGSIKNTGSPPWMGNLEFHASHRSKLLYKGRVDAVCYSIRSHFHFRSINEKLAEWGYPQKNLLKHIHVELLEKFAAEQNIQVSTNWYKKFLWTEPDTLPYCWPTKQLSA
jgi:hypothetical protein